MNWKTILVIVAVWWIHRLAYQYSHHRTEPFYILKITWQQVSAGACMPSDWSTNPARHFVLHVAGLRAIEYFKSDLGMSIKFMQFEIFGYALYPKSRRFNVFILEIEFSFDLKRDIVSPIEKMRAESVTK